jgi:hypothetical protein
MSKTMLIFLLFVIGYLLIESEGNDSHDLNIVL